MILVLVNFLVDFMNLAYIKVDGSKTSFDMYLFKTGSLTGLELHEGE